MNVSDTGALAMDTAQLFRSPTETYRAVARAEIAAAVGAASPFTIEVAFLGGLTQAQMDAFTAAADRWVRIIVGNLPDVLVDGEVIDDVVILAQGAAIDGPGSILGQAGPTHLRPSTAGAAALIPAKGIMSFDIADLEQMAAAETLHDVITHEMGHVLGIGTIWTMKGLTQQEDPTNPVFIGELAMGEYGSLRGADPMPVPLENTGGPGTRGSHWREAVFEAELMTGFIDTPPNPCSRLTAASLQDCGYQVDLAAADAYALPDLRVLADAGLLVERTAPIDHGVMLPVIPVQLPPDSLV
jgi:hypothetical protein